MDGYALRAADVGSASKQSPVQLAVVGDVAAGNVLARHVEPGARCVL
ncbi:MAG: hypothetical protein M5U34_44410 [Chloroflexi bacterium]|nr:hypothetical protein [Chloroflexota bacterium]